MPHALIALVLVVMSLWFPTPARADDTILNGTIALSTDSTSIDLSGLAMKGYSIEAIITNATPALVSAPAVNVANSNFTLANNGLFNGVAGHWSTTGALPAPVTAASVYYVVGVSGSAFQVATAAGISAVVLTATGSGVQTFTPDPLNSSFKVQRSDDQSHWIDVSGSSTAVTGAAVLSWNSTAEPFDYVHLSYVASQGAVGVVARYRAKSYSGKP